MPLDVDTLLQHIADRGGDAPAAIHALAMAGTEGETIIPEVTARLSGPTDPAAARRAAGAFYTPPPLVALLLDQSLDPWMEAHGQETPITLDPACGTGRFLLAAGERLTARWRGRHGGSVAESWRRCGPSLRGFDVDPLATAWLRGRLTALAGGDAAAASGIRTIDAFDDDALPGVKADVILGNPPFGSPLRSRTPAEGLRRRASALFGVPIGAYADQAAIFLLAATRALRRGGRLGMVQPISLLTARDTTAIRDAITSTCCVTFAWSSSTRVFDAQVHTVALALHHSKTRPSIARRADLPPRTLPDATALSRGSCWSSLASAALGVPDAPTLQTGGTLGDIARATADFRDQYYGLRDAIESVRSSPPADVAPVVTSGALDPARCAWADRDIRLHGRRWRRPGIRLSKLDADMRRWAATRLVPKVLLPTQTRVLEPVLDERGHWLPSVPVMTITSDRLAAVAAVLACPAVSIHAMHRRLGAARSPHAIKLSASDVLQLPTPAGEDAWAAAAESFESAQAAEDDAARYRHLTACGRAMHAAYGLDRARGEPMLQWWLDRAPRRR
ncbi:MAG: N-6 DNA methylase [Phycisphaerales bacterium]|jgi:hypothetical protein|nr:N-6 DNA methylase [Phycisphaerales bacterium]